MKFFCSLVCGLILFCICFRVTGSSPKLTAIQSPSSITVNEGDSAQISCCWNKSEPGVIVKVAWHINKTKFEGVKEDLQERQTQNCSTLHLTNILKNYTGHWVCKVSQDIPVLLQWQGNGTDLSVRVRKLEETTTENVPTVPTIPTTVVQVSTPTTMVQVSNPPTMVQVPTRLPAASSSREVVMIYVFRSLPFICLVMAFFYLNRDDKQATVSKPVENAGPDEDLEVGDGEAEDMKRDEKARDGTEKAEDTAATEEERNEEKETVVVVEPLHEDENKSVSVLDTEEKANLMAAVENVTVCVQGGVVSAL